MESYPEKPINPSIEQPINPSIEQPINPINGQQIMGNKKSSTPMGTALRLKA
jgi:hypothetical protein